MLEFSRGCLHACGYCSWNSDKRLRFFGPERIEADIRWVLDHGHRHVTVNDAALNYSTAHLRALIEAVERADPEGLVQFTYNVRHDAVTPEQLALLGRLPTHMVLLGVETFEAPAMAHVDRAPVDVAALREALKAISRAVRPPVASIVLGLPGDTEEGFRHTLDTLLSWTKPDDDGVAPVGTVLVSLLQVYRGSKLWQQREALGMRFSEWGIPYLEESASWSKLALARTKSWLLGRMAEQPDQLKAAEAIVLMEVMGGIDPWFTRRRVEQLMRPWEIGMTLQGWALEQIGIMRDTGQGVLMRFRREDGAGVRVRLLRPNPNRPPALKTRFYEIQIRRLPGPSAPSESIQELVRLVRGAIVRGERALLARVAARRRKRAEQR